MSANEPESTGPVDAASPPAAAVRWTGDELPRDGRLLGIDYGSVRLGFALSTPEQNLSTPLETWTRYGAAHDLRRLRELIEEFYVKGIVLGLPLHMGGEEGSSAHQAREFGRWLRNETGLPVGFWDERCSSAAADEWMFAAEMTRGQRKARRDMLAAHVILQSYLDFHHPAPPRESTDEDEPAESDDPDSTIE